jgi:F0F1-type ATP synthase assembly protein I
MPEPTGRQDRRVQGWVRLTGIGVEFAAAVGAFCALGWWIDHHWKIEQHWGLLSCAILGLVGGMYNLVRQALAAVKPSDQDSKRGPEAPSR